MDRKQLTFIQQAGHDDLSPCKEIVMRYHKLYADPNQEERVQKQMADRFTIIEEWHKNKEKNIHFFKILEKEKSLIGCMAIEQLENPSSLALHCVGLEGGCEGYIAYCLKALKELFPGAKKVSIACPGDMKAMQKTFRLLMFKTDESYICNRDLAMKDSVGFTLDLDLFNSLPDA